MFFQPFGGARARRRMAQFGRVYIRAPVQRDWRNWAALRAESRDFLVPWEPTWAYDALTRSAFRRRLRMYRAETRQGLGYSFLVFRQSDDVLLGGITLSNVRRGVAQTASLGYWVGAPFSQRGYMTEAIACILRFAFKDLGLHRVEAACLSANVASKSLLRKSGFREEGLARQYLRINGNWQDHVLFAILRSDHGAPQHEAGDEGEGGVRADAEAQA